MHLLNISVHSLAAGDQELLQSSRNTSGLDTDLVAHLRCNLRLKQGARHLLLGRNGCGKSTLLRAIAYGKLEGLPDNLRVHLVDQDAPVDLDSSPLDVVLAADSKLLALNKEVEELELLCDTCDDASKVDDAGIRICEIYEIMAESDDGQRQRQARKILSGLGFENEKMEVPLNTLSGGWRMRCLLAAALFMEPELLLLDEPTNHLDLDATTWLQQHLSVDFPHTVLCVSHTKAFVNAIADEIIVFTENRSLEYFTGNLHDLYKHAEKMARRHDRQDAARQKQMDQIDKKNDKLEQQMARMESGLSANVTNNRYGCYQGTGVTNIDKNSARIKKGKKKLERLGLEADGHKPLDIDPVSLQVIESNDDSWAAALAPRFQSEDSALKFAFKEAEPLNLPLDIPMLELRAVDYRYANGNEQVFTNVDLSIVEKCRIAIRGKNGAGKSTLVKLLTGELMPTSGEVARNQNLRIAQFGQHDAEVLQQRNVTPFQYLEETFPKMRQHELCTQLATFGIVHDVMGKPMSKLSGGQRMRVAFARMCAEEPHLLILDEPTNHLDIYAIEALSDALKEFKGGVIFVTHDKCLIEEVADSVVVVGGRGTGASTGIRLERAAELDKKRFNLDTG
jgi:ATPase subunit of ABC transporter with duplicated ATPase domains